MLNVIRLIILVIGGFKTCLICFYSSQLGRFSSNKYSIIFIKILQMFVYVKGLWFPSDKGKGTTYYFIQLDGVKITF